MTKLTTIKYLRRRPVRAFGVKGGFWLQVVFFGALSIASLQAEAAEEGKSIYLLGSSTSMAGFVPPPGTYVSSIDYVYKGDASGVVGASRALPSGGSVTLNADISVEARIALAIKSMLWVAPQKVLGGFAGVGVLVPVGYQEAAVDIDARATLTLRNGTVIQAGQHRRISDETWAFGDPLVTTFIGWHEGNWHVKLASLLNVPIGSYDEANIANMGFNRWAADFSAAATWLDQKRGHEASATVGVTFNGENPDTDYKTGTELHFEAALMQYLSPAFAIGVVGYHYEQITGDTGAAQLLGSFKGRATAVGPNFNYNFQLGQIPISTSFRWLHEVDVKNRLKGDAAFLTVTVPLGGGAR